MNLDILKVFVPSIISFCIGILGAPILAHYLYKYKMWKKKNVQFATDGSVATLSQKLYNDEEKKTPRMGGIIVWMSTLITALLFWFIAHFIGGSAGKFDFISRSQTWLPLSVMLIGATVGFFDDLSVTGNFGSYVGGGLSLRFRILVVALLGSLVGYWFYVKLGISMVILPFFGVVQLGLFFIPLLILTMLAIFSGGIIDGVDGLSGGIMGSIFAAYGLIALINHQVDISAFCFTVAGSILAFLWFNIPPARFYMSETGMLGLTTALTVVAFMTHAVAELIIIALPLFVTSLSSIIQLLSKKYRGKKVFLVAPLHNHFQIAGWPAPKVTMRYWIVGIMCALTGVVIHLLG